MAISEILGAWFIALAVVMFAQATFTRPSTESNPRLGPGRKTIQFVTGVSLLAMGLVALLLGLRAIKMTLAVELLSGVVVFMSVAATFALRYILVEPRAARARR